MSAPELIADEMGTLLSALRPFPFSEGSKIPTAEFLEAANGITVLLDALGKVLAPIRSDMQQNVMKLTAKYEEDKKKHEFIEDMILTEQIEDNVLTIDALLWLRRNLHFIQRFFECLLQDEREVRMTKFIKTAYAETLEPYHGWIGLQIMNILCRYAWSRNEFYYKLAKQRHKSGLVQQHVIEYLPNLAKCVQYLTKLYADHNLDRFIFI